MRLSVILRSVVSVVLLGVAAPAALAEGMLANFRIGVLAHDVPYLWSGFQVETPSADLNLEAVFSPSVAFLGGRINPAAGVSISSAGETSHAYLDARWQIDTPSGVFLAAGVGVAVHDGLLGPGDLDRKWLGSRVLFHIPFEVGVHVTDDSDVSLYFEHFSNAGTQAQNEGFDRLGLRYGVRF